MSAAAAGGTFGRFSSTVGTTVGLGTNRQAAGIQAEFLVPRNLLRHRAAGRAGNSSAPSSQVGQVGQGKSGRYGSVRGDKCGRGSGDSKVLGGVDALCRLGESAARGPIPSRGRSRLSPGQDVARYARDTQTVGRPHEPLPTASGPGGVHDSSGPSSLFPAALCKRRCRPGSWSVR